tara:strand:- start:1353 stop:1664 length:312 start_codon:yes stop_codon:yes gene_type:complete
MKLLILTLILFSLGITKADDDEYEYIDMTIDLGIGIGLEICDQYEICRFTVSLLVLCFTCVFILDCCMSGIDLGDINWNRFFKRIVVCVLGYIISRYIRNNIY